MIGTGLTSFALGVWVLQQTGSVTAFATISAIAVLPAIVALPVAGAVADRFDRRKVMLAADSAAGVMTAALVALLATGHLELWFIYAFAAIGSLATAFQRPAYLAAITQLVPKQYLGQANGLVSLGINSGDVVAAVAGGTLLGLLGLPGVITIDAITFLSAVAVIVRVRFPDRLFVRLEESFRNEVLGGWRYVVARPEMIAMVAFFLLFNYLFTFPLVLATPVVLANHSPAVLGLVLGCGGLGGVAGAALMALWGGTTRKAIGMVGGTAVLGFAVVIAGATADPVVIGVGLFGVYGSLLVLNAHWLSLIQTKVGLELQGRVLAANQMVATAMMPVGFLTVGPVTGWVDRTLAAPGRPLHWLGGLFGDADGRGYGVTMVLVGLVLAGWGVAGVCYPRLRDMDATLPDAVATPVFSDRDSLQRAADAQLAGRRSQ
jgi:MFS family permease